MRGFTLIELMIVVGILGVLSMIAIPMYRGYTDTARISLVKNNLRTVYLQEREYFVNNNAYYSTGPACTQSFAAINTNLFSNKQVLSTADNFTYCILQNTTADFTARAVEIGGQGRTYTLDYNNVANF